jgi:hypothetical protein
MATRWVHQQTLISPPPLLLLLLCPVILRKLKITAVDLDGIALITFFILPCRSLDLTFHI